MKKVFFKLIEEISILGGGPIVFADFGRLIICTRKTEATEGLNHVEYVVNTLCSRELFRSLDLQYKRSWSILFWMDKLNFTGIKINVDSLTGTPSQEKENINPNDAGEENANEDFDLQWHMARYLPAHFGLRSKFYAFVAGFVSAARQILLEEFEKHKGNDLMTTVAPEEGNMVDIDAVTEEEQTPKEVRLGSDASQYPIVIERLQNLIKDKLAPEMYALVMRLQRRSWTSDTMAKEHLILHALSPQDLSTRGQTPLLPRYQLDKLTGNEQYVPLLDFIKFTCQVLLLYTNISDVVGSMRRDLLRLINISDFSAMANWTLPHVPCGHQLPAGWSGLIILPDLACSHCNYIHSMDVLREVQLIQINDEFGVGWPCPACSASFNNGLLEEKLCAQLDDLVKSHVLQDIVCITCGRIQERMMSQTRCECATGAPYRYSRQHSTELLLEQLHGFADLALSCGFDWLNEKVECLLSLSSASQ